MYSYAQTQLAEQPFSSLWYFSGQVIEKFGNIDLYFFPVNDRACDGGCPFGLRCYQDEDQTLNFIGGTDCSIITSVQYRPLGISLEIYPSPASEVLYIKDPNSQVRAIEIYNLQGRNMIQEEKSDHVDLSGLVSGFYIVVLRSSTGQPLNAFKLIKK
ncbi:MAG: T9SS type A sorting domain-containing protein [Saprospiraceae bacterium]|nr:T9SS type A sorting domain-containing protein [Saprospiraceae bacterium]